MRAHLSLFVSDLEKSVDFYSRVFSLEPQKKTNGYAKFDLKKPALNFVLNQSQEKKTGQISHLGIEVEKLEEVAEWKKSLEKAKIMTTEEKDTDCCYALQDKVWFSDPDGNNWEVFFVKQQLPIEKPVQGKEEKRHQCCA